MFDVRESRGKGRGLFANRDVKAGEVVLTEQPLLLVVNQEYCTSVCSNCLRFAPGGTVCPACGRAVFCSPDCQQAASGTPHVHSPELCRALSKIASYPLTTEEQNQARFLLHILALKAMQAHDPEQRFNKFLQLVGTPSAGYLAIATKLQPCITDAAGISVSVDELATLLCKEQLNSYGILAGVGPDGARSIRGCGVYEHASLLNHECAPTVVRFDNFDGPSPDSTTITFRAIHDLPAGTELVQSYIPMGWDVKERQPHLRQVYGFDCRCPRCQTETSAEWDLAGSSGGDWETESEDEEGDAGDASMVEGEADLAAGDQQAGPSTSHGEGGAPDEKPLDPTYLQLFLLKYMCPKPNCGGTFAPLALQPNVYECNVCSHKRTEEEFLAELESQ